MSSSRKDVKTSYFKKVLNAYIYVLVRVNPAVLLLKKACWFYSINGRLQFKHNRKTHLICLHTLKYIL